MVETDGAIENEDLVVYNTKPFAASTHQLELGADIVILGEQGGFLGVGWEAESVVRTTDTLGLESNNFGSMLFVNELVLEGSELEDLFPYGLVSLPDQNELTISETSGTPICTLPGGCTCPPGSPGEGIEFLQTTKGAMLVGIAGHTTGSFVTVSGKSRDEFCAGPGVLAGPEEGARYRYYLAGGEWDYEHRPGVHPNGCPWPGGTYSGTFPPYQQNVLSTNYIDFRINGGRLEYKAFVAGDEQYAPPVTVDECPGKWNEFEVSFYVGAIYINQPDWTPVSGNSITGSFESGGSEITWTISRIAPDRN